MSVDTAVDTSGPEWTDVKKAVAPDQEPLREYKLTDPDGNPVSIFTNAHGQNRTATPRGMPCGSTSSSTGA